MTETKVMRGTITTQHTIWCGRCTRWDQASGRVPTLTKEWKLRGWTHTQKDGWICPTCAGHPEKATDPGYHLRGEEMARGIPEAGIAGAIPVDAPWEWAVEYGKDPAVFRWGAQLYGSGRLGDANHPNNVAVQQADLLSTYASLRVRGLVAVDVSTRVLDPILEGADTNFPCEVNEAGMVRAREGDPLFPLVLLREFIRCRALLAYARERSSHE